MGKEKVLIGMSGGIDSSVAALLLKDRGYEVIGITMKLHDSMDEFSKDLEDAKRICKKLKIKHYTVDFSTEFKTKVIDDFVSNYMDTKTPNPCIECNRWIKFGKLYEKAVELGCKYIATGHYAKVIYSDKYGRYVIAKSNSSKKDQTYVLYGIDKNIIEHIIFPLSEFSSKDDIKKIAIENEFNLESKKESQEICFIPDNDYVSYIEKSVKKKFESGDIVDKKNSVLGKHNGIIRYTIGQRRGLGISSKTPLYVTGLLKEENKVIVSEENDLYTDEVIIKDVNLHAVDYIEDGMEVTAKIRYAAKEANARLYNYNGNIKIVFDNKQRAVTPGQSVVFYDRDVLIGGGKII